MKAVLKGLFLLSALAALLSCAITAGSTFQSTVEAESNGVHRTTRP